MVRGVRNSDVGAKIGVTIVAIIPASLCRSLLSRVEFQRHAVAYDASNIPSSVTNITSMTIGRIGIEDELKEYGGYILRYERSCSESE